MLKSRRIFALAAYLFFVSALATPIFAASSNQISIERALKDLKIFYRDLLSKHGIAGSSLTFIHDNKIIFEDYFGMANLDLKQKVDPCTIYHWASITKTMAGIAIMQLRDRGLLKLDDPAIKYLPELENVYNPHGTPEDITIRHLMTHSAGFRAPTWPWKDKPWHPHEPLHWEQLVAMFPYTEVKFPPGSRFFMSNLGIIFLGRIVEIITTDDWETYIEKNLFKPLKMHRSYFDTTPYHLMKDKAQSYFNFDGNLNPADPDVNTGITVSNGGLKAPVGDMAKYINFLLGNPDNQEVYDLVLKRSSLEEMWRPYLEILDLEREYRGRDRKDSIGLTFYLEDNFGMSFVAHRGSQNAFISHFFINPLSRTAYIVAFNTHAAFKEKSTAVVDIAIKEYLFENIFSLFKAGAESE